MITIKLFSVYHKYIKTNIFSVRVQNRPRESNCVLRRISSLSRYLHITERTVLSEVICDVMADSDSQVFYFSRCSSSFSMQMDLKKRMRR